MPNTESIFDKQGTERVSSFSVVQRKGKRILFFAIVAVLIAIGGVVFFVFPKSDKNTFVLKTWTESVVSLATINDTVSSTGVIELINKETILAPQTAQVSAVYIVEGETITKGKALVRLASDQLEWDLVVAQSAYDVAVRDATMVDTEYDFSIRQQDITIKTAERNLKTAQEKLVQTQGLFERNIASSSELTTAVNAVADNSDSLELANLMREQTIAKHRIALTNRKNELEQKKKEIQDLVDSIDACTIRSLTSGRVYSLSVAVGDRVSAYATVAVIAKPSDIQVGIDVAENRINEVKIGNPVFIIIGESTVQGTVKSIASSATSSTSSSSSTIHVLATFNTIPVNAIVGGSVSADIRVGVLENALVLPRGPYLSSGNYSSAYVIKNGNRAIKKDVDFGITDGNSIQIISGLNEEDTIVTSAYQEFIHLEEIELAK